MRSMGAELRVYLAEQDADPERLDRATGFLRQELLELDVEDVTLLRAGAAPPGTRAIDVALVGGLMVALGQTATALQAVVSTVSGWLSRGQGTNRTVRIEIDGDVLELSEATSADQMRLLELFVGRHTATGTGNQR
ncbi:hypothetical protein [Streptosporangium sp. KLBMP 9127]|nr:hypothetical protein [Streptosporangium sp. KLBMP 9127]